MAFFNWPFTANKLQVSTYLFGVALFPISFLVFLNASVSFVVTDLIGQEQGVGNAVGSLGFADELVALIACPIWGILSDKLGVRTVCVTGYLIVGVSLFVFVQARNVYPQLLLARILFSVGGAATSTMVTAVLPTMTYKEQDTSAPDSSSRPVTSRDSNHASSLSTASATTEATITPARYQATESVEHKSSPPRRERSKTSQVAGLVGMFTGIGALIALTIFLPLPAHFSKDGYSRGDAITASFYIVGAIALLVAIVCFFGLRNLPGEDGKGPRTLFSKNHSYVRSTTKSTSTLSLLRDSVVLGFTDLSIGIGYLGGFVARASSVGISLFIPLFINAYFIRSGLCPSPSTGQPSDPSDVKAHCRQAYTRAAALSGVSQVVALVCAPVFGLADGKFGARMNAPLMFAALAGVIGYIALAMIEQPDRGGVIWLCMILVGMSQIGAIVCSLSSLSRGIENELESEDSVKDRQSDDDHADGIADERAALIPAHLGGASEGQNGSRAQLKGTIAGLYSLSGGAGILLLTKLGGYLFDRTDAGAPFYMMAIFNAILLIVTATCTALTYVGRGQQGLGT